MFGEMVRGEGYFFGQAKDWMGRLEENLRDFGIKCEGWVGRQMFSIGGRWGGGVHAETV